MNVLQELQDKEAIRQLCTDYSAAVDNRDWLLLRNCYLDEIEIDYGDFAKNGKWNADDWVAQLKLGVSGFDNTQHLNGNHTIQIDGDTAQCSVHVIAEHVIYPQSGLVHVDDKSSITFGGTYFITYQRTPAQWRIAKAQLTALWTRGNMGLFNIAKDRYLASQN